MDKNKQKKKLIIKVTASVLALAFVLTVSTFSWFYQGDSANVNDVTVDVSDAVNVSASTDGSHFTNQIKIDLKGQKTVKEYSGDGRNFYTPNFGYRNEVTTYNHCDFTKEQKGYIEFSFFIQSEDQFNFYLDKGSTVTPLDPKNNLDKIAGAIRFAFFTPNNPNIFIWIPNPTYEIDVNGQVKTNGKVEDKYIFACKDKQFPTEQFAETIPGDNVYEVLTNGQPNGYDPKTGRVVWGDIGEIKDSQNIKPIFQSTESKITTEVITRIWIEGNDRETDSRLIGGQFKFNLKFRAGALTK